MLLLAARVSYNTGSAQHLLVVVLQGTHVLWWCAQLDKLNILQRVQLHPGKVRLSLNGGIAWSSADIPYQD